MAEVRASMHEGSVISSHTIDSLTMDHKEAWRQLRRELEDIGISAEILKAHQQFIVTWFREAIEAGALVEASDARENSDAAKQNEWKGTQDLVYASTSGRENVRAHSLLRSASERESADLKKYFQTRFNQSTIVSKSKPAHHNQDGSGSVDKPRSTSLSYMIQKLFESTRQGLIDAIKLGDEGRVDRLWTETKLNVHSRLDRLNNTALHYAAEEGRYEIAQLLLEKGADVEAKNYHDYTALHFASWCSENEIAELLLDREADINIKSHKNRTALHMAVNLGYSAMVELLLQKRADIEATKPSRETPLNVAQLYNRRAEINILRREAIKRTRDSGSMHDLHSMNSPPVSGARKGWDKIAYIPFSGPVKIMTWIGWDDLRTDAVLSKSLFASEDLYEAATMAWRVIPSLRPLHNF